MNIDGQPIPSSTVVVELSEDGNSLNFEIGIEVEEVCE